MQQYLGDNGEASLHRRRLVPIYGLPWLQVCANLISCVLAVCLHDLVTISGLVHTYCLRGAFPPVDLRAVCFVRAILRFPLCFDSDLCCGWFTSVAGSRRRCQLGHATIL